ncbi:MAG: hypothetical protein ABSE99_17875 [Terracidiphilus sp.]
MKRLLCVGAAVLMAFCAATAFAADVTGTWSGDMKTPDGNSFHISFMFKQDGAKLTGTVQGPRGDPIEIADGKIDGDKLSFTVSFNGMTIQHEGVLHDDEIKLTTKTDQGDFPGGEMTLTRSK